MYNDYFGLREAPFSIAPNPQYLFMSPRHREALAHLLYGIQSDGGFILLTGEVGTGKTTVCRCLLEQIPEDVDTAYILNPKQTAQELLATACDEFKVEYPEGASIKVLVDALNKFLLEAHQQSRKTVLIIDEAQNLSVDVLEQLRLLTNLETNQRKLLQIILLGQPELLTLLAKQELRQLSQRVTARFHLDALNKDEVEDYIQHRLDTAGSKGSLFPPASVKRIFQISNGIPRLINLVCDRALLGTYVQNRLQVDVATVNNAAKEILGDQQKSNGPWIATAAASIAVAAIGVWIYLSPTEPMPVAENSAPQIEVVTPEIVETTQTETIEEISVPEPVEQETDTASGIDLASLDLAPTDLAIVAGEIVAEPIELPEETSPQTEELATTVADDEPSRISVLIPAPNPISAMTDIADASGFATQQAAFAKLLEIWDIEVVLSAQTDACEVAAISGLQCLSKLGSLRDIAHMNRPVILNLTAGDQSRWYVVTNIGDDFVEVASNGDKQRLSAAQVLEVWSGFYTLLWRTPPAYQQPAKLGDRGAAIDWLQTQLSFVEGSEVPLSIEGSVFDTTLESRVKRFQISVGLVPDGIVGPQTWIHLNSADASNIPKLD